MEQLLAGMSGGPMGAMTIRNTILLSQRWSIIQTAYA